MKPGRGLIEDQKRVAFGALLNKGDELEPLGLASGQIAQRMTQCDEAKAEFLKNRCRFADPAAFGEEFVSGIHGHAKEIVDVLPLVLDLENRRLKPPAQAAFARNEDIAEELHVFADEAGSLTCRPPSGADVEGKR